MRVDSLTPILGDVDGATVDAAGERERHPVGINSPHHRSDAERGSLRRDDLQPYPRPLWNRASALSSAVGYAWMAHLSALRVTSTVKRPPAGRARRGHPSGRGTAAECHQAVEIEVRAPLGALDDVVDLEPSGHRPGTSSGHGGIHGCRDGQTASESSKPVTPVGSGFLWR